MPQNCLLRHPRSRWRSNDESDLSDGRADGRLVNTPLPHQAVAKHGTQSRAKAWRRSRWGLDGLWVGSFAPSTTPACVHTVRPTGTFSEYPEPSRNAFGPFGTHGGPHAPRAYQKIVPVRCVCCIACVQQRRALGVARWAWGLTRHGSHPRCGAAAGAALGYTMSDVDDPFEKKEFDDTDAPPRASATEQAQAPIQSTHDRAEAV